MKRLNQTTSREVPEYVDVMGIALAANNTVPVDQSKCVESGQKCREPAGQDRFRFHNSRPGPLMNL